MSHIGFKTDNSNMNKELLWTLLLKIYVSNIVIYLKLWFNNPQILLIPFLTINNLPFNSATYFFNTPIK